MTIFLAKSQETEHNKVGGWATISLFIYWLLISGQRSHGTCISTLPQPPNWQLIRQIDRHPQSNELSSKIWYWWTGRGNPLYFRVQKVYAAITTELLENDFCGRLPTQQDDMFSILDDTSIPSDLDNHIYLIWMSFGCFCFNVLPCVVFAFF